MKVNGFSLRPHLASYIKIIFFLYFPHFFLNVFPKRSSGLCCDEEIKV